MTGAVGSLGSQSLSYLIGYVSMLQLHQFSIEKLSGPCIGSVVALGTASPLIEIGNLSLPSPAHESMESWEDSASFISHSLAGVLQSLSSVRKIVVSDIGHVLNPHLTELLHLLTPGQNLEAVLCPALQELVITFCGNRESSALEKMIQGRMQFVPDFWRLEIQDPCVPNLILEAQIQFYRSQGLDIGQLP
jgi:hypothetical protein